MENPDGKESMDADLLQKQHVPRRMIKDRANPFEYLSCSDFVAQFGISKESCIKLIDLFNEELSFDSKRCHAIPPHLRILVTLGFYTTGFFQTTVGDPMQMKKSTVCKIIHQVSKVIAKRRNEFIKFPTGVQERESERTAFNSERLFPGVIGLIGATHIPIVSPGGEQAEQFRNEEGYFSINVQIICKSNMQFSHIVARWPGSTSDSMIFEASTVPSVMSDTRNVLLGGSSYPSLPWLMSPISTPETPSEEEFNEAHTEMLTKLDESTRLWKQRFGCLRIPLRTKLENTLIIIVATACLHNFAIHRGDESPTVRYPDISGIDETLVSPLSDFIAFKEIYEEFLAKSCS